MNLFRTVSGLKSDNYKILPPLHVFNGPSDGALYLEILRLRWC